MKPPIIPVEKLIRLAILGDFVHVFQQEIRKQPRESTPDLIVLAIDRRSTAGADYFKQSVDEATQRGAGGDRFAIGTIPGKQLSALLHAAGMVPRESDLRLLYRMRFDHARVLCIGTPSEESGGACVLLGRLLPPAGGWESPLKPGKEFEAHRVRAGLLQAFQEDV